MLDDMSVLRRDEVMRLRAPSPSSLYKLVSTGGFPRPVQIGASAVARRQTEVVARLPSRPSTSDGHRRWPGSSISRSWAARQTTIHLKIVGVS